MPDSSANPLNLRARAVLRTRTVLSHRRWPIALAVLSLLLCLPSLRLGWILDDHYHRVMLQGHGQLGQTSAPTDLFAFGDVSESSPSLVPWWADDDLRIRFFRPLTSLSHALDFALWPSSPAAMHGQSLFWFALTVLAVALFYRTLVPRGSATIESTTIAGLAALFFTVDDAHAAPAMWLANRSALMALFFGVLALLAHHRRRRWGWSLGGVATPVALALTMFSAESGLGAGAYLLAYALFLDRGPLRERLLALWPSLAVGLGWATLYWLGGFGTHGSGVYLDPISEPANYAAAILERAPALLFGQFAFPPTDLFMYFSASVAHTAQIIVWLFAAALVWLIWPLLKEDATCRFAAFGMALSVLPLCATLPSNRLLGWVSLGGSFLLAAVLVRVWQKSDQTPTLSRRVWKISGRALTPLLVLVHLVLASLFLVGAPSSFERIDHYFTAPAATLPTDDSRPAILLNAPNFYFAALAPIWQAAQGHTLPAEILTLATGVFEIEYERVDLRTLRVRPRGGFLMVPGTAPGSPGSASFEKAPPFSFGHFLQSVDRLYWNGDAFELGEHSRRRDISVRVVSLSDDGRPSEVDFVFDGPLEESDWRWLRFDSAAGFVESAPPGPGDTLVLPALKLRLMGPPDSASK